jgi:hypothetical protein
MLVDVAGWVAGGRQTNKKNCEQIKTPPKAPKKKV